MLRIGQTLGFVSNADSPRLSRLGFGGGRVTEYSAASAPFRAADYLRSDTAIAAYIEDMLAGGDARAVPIALRTLADALGGMNALSERSGLSRETLYRTLSEKGNPRLDTLAALLAAFGLRLSVRPLRKKASRRRATESGSASAKNA
ncbi:MAG: addiction module antidote protein [Gammaproteobacteria bacterium]